MRSLATNANKLPLESRLDNKEKRANKFQLPSLKLVLFKLAMANFTCDFVLFRQLHEGLVACNYESDDFTTKARFYWLNCWTWWKFTKSSPEKSVR